MCSLIGFKVGTSHKHEEKVGKYLEILKERGDQSFGYIYRTPEGKIFFMKSLTLPSIEGSKKAIPKDSWCFLHARKASAGMITGTYDVKIARAHPVESDDKSILLLHNGTKSSLFNTVYGSVSDSQALATLLSFSHSKRRMYFGDTGVVIYEKESDVYLYKDGIRPLVMAEDETIFASEPVDDSVRWRNISNTYSYINEAKTDVKLDFSADTLGLTCEAPVAITFELAEFTVANYYTKGIPKSSYCSSCKCSHLKDKDKYICCVCSIQGKKSTSAYSHRNNTTYEKDKKTGATTTTTIIKTMKELEKGVIEQSVRDTPMLTQEVLYACDSNLVKLAGFKNVLWKGTAVIKTDYVYRTMEGLIFAVPNPAGKYLVKVDKLFVDRNAPAFKKVWNRESSTLVRLLGNLMKVPEVKLKANINFAVAVRNYQGGLAPMTSKVTKLMGKLIQQENVGFNSLKLNLKLLSN